MSSARRASMFIWISSRSSLKTKTPLSISDFIWSRPAAILAPSCGDIMSCATSMAQCAFDPAMSSLYRRLSNSIDALMRRMISAGPPVKRPPHTEFAGRLVLINLWATWCEPCLREMPSLERMQSRLGDKITVVAISEDRGGSKTVEPFINKLGLKSFKIYLDPKSDAGRAFKVAGLPTSFLIDREGRVLGRIEGAAEWDSPKLLGVLKSFLGADEVIKASFRRARP